jgi:Zn finger protein HypA/HybF involved in hydrogenase expression
MQESTLGKQVLNVVLMKAWESRAHRVERVRCRVSTRAQVDPSAIAFHFAALAKGTAAEGAQLDLDTVVGEPSLGIEHIDVA